MSSPLRPILVLDLDGTLVDTAPDLVATLNVVLASEGVPTVATEDAVPMIGHGARAMLERALLARGEKPTEARLDALFRRFVDHYGSHLSVHSRPFPGAAAALDRFTSQGWTLAVCTNKFAGLSRTLLAQLGLADRFAVIAGQDSFAYRKPDPRHLTETVRQAGGSERSAVMVGDSEVDVATARAAGIPVVAVTFGYSTVPAADLGADAIIEHFDALFETASRLVRGHSR